MGIFSFIGSIFKPAADLIDSLHTSDEEKMQLRNEHAKMQFQFQSKVLEYETKLMESKADIISAEAKSGHFITSAWRPITMLAFTGIIIARWFGLTADNISADLEQQLFEIIKIGIGGYIVGRSGEKMVKAYKDLSLIHI